MSTRALYTFKANPHSEFEQDWNVYKHHDGYPSGAADAITAALKKAWELPRYESDEFAAAFIAANKPSNGGGVRLMPQGDPLEVAQKHCADIEYRYEIYLRCDIKSVGTHAAVYGDPIGLYVRAYDVNIAWRDEDVTTEKKLFDVAISKLKSTAKHVEKANA